MKKLLCMLMVLVLFCSSASARSWVDSLADFPTTEEQARRKAEASWQTIDGRDLVMLYGNVNLRASEVMEGSASWHGKR